MAISLALPPALADVQWEAYTDLWDVIAIQWGLKKIVAVPMCCSSEHFIVAIAPQHRFASLHGDGVYASLRHMCDSFSEVRSRLVGRGRYYTGRVARAGCFRFDTCHGSGGCSVLDVRYNERYFRRCLAYGFRFARCVRRMDRRSRNRHTGFQVLLLPTSRSDRRARLRQIRRRRRRGRLVRRLL